VRFCAERLAGAGCEQPKIERDGEQLERSMSSSRLYWAGDDEVTEENGRRKHVAPIDLRKIRTMK
jgi:hypothetical protein